MADIPKIPHDIRLDVSPGGEQPPDIKRERIIPRTVAHAFVLKSAAPEYIKEKIAQGVPLHDLQFSHAVFSREKDPSGKDSLAPMGCVMLKERKELIPKKGRKKAFEEELDRDLRRRIGEELFSQGSVRGTAYGLLYKRDTYGSEDQPIQEAFVCTEASPFDTLHSLSSEGDTKTYAYLDTLDFRRAVSQAGKRDTSLPPLQISGIHAAVTRNALPDHVAKKLNNALRQAESRKKREVLHALTILLGGEQSKIYSPMATEEAYKKFIEERQVTPEQLLEALSLANLMEEIRHLDAHCGPIESVLRIIGVMPQLKSLPPKAFTVLRNSKNIGPYVEKLVKGVLEWDEEDMKRRDFSSFFVDVLERLGRMVQYLDTHPKKDKNKSDVHEQKSQKIEEAFEIMEKAFGIPRERYYDLAAFYDGFSKQQSADIIRRELGTEVSASAADPLNDVINRNPADLLQIACGVGPIVEKYARESTAIDPILTDRLIFEARWKLYCLKIIDEVLDHLRKKVEQGNDECRDVWMECQGIPVWDIQKFPVYNIQGNLIDIVTNRDTDAQALAHYQTQAESKAVKIGEKQEDKLRTLTLHDGQVVLARVGEREVKDAESLLRKRLHGKGEPRDLFAREIIIVSCDPKLLERIDKTIEVLEDKVKGQEGGELVPSTETFNDHGIVFEIIHTFRKHAQELLGDDWICEVYDFDPTPQGQDYAFEGKRPGSGGKIRLSKFTFILRNKRTGEEDAEEVQMFIPGIGKSGLYFHEEKKRDDHDFQIRRLLEKYGMRSIAELRFPPSLYPAMPAVYRKRKAQKETK